MAVGRFLAMAGALIWRHTDGKYLLLQRSAALEEKRGLCNEEGYKKQLEQERVEKERIHREAFVGTPTLKELLKKMCSDYQEYIHRHRAESPWKYSAKDV